VGLLVHFYRIILLYLRFDGGEVSWELRDEFLEELVVGGEFGAGLQGLLRLQVGDLEDLLVIILQIH